MTRTNHVRTRTQPQNYYPPAWQNTMLVPPLTRGQVYYGNVQQYKQYMELRHSVNPFPGVPQTTYTAPQIPFYNKQAQCTTHELQACRPTSLFIPNLQQGTLLDPGLPHGPLGMTNSLSVLQGKYKLAAPIANQYLGNEVNMRSRMSTAVVSTPDVLPQNLPPHPLQNIPQSYSTAAPDIITPETAVSTNATIIPYSVCSTNGSKHSSLSLSELTPPTSDQSDSGRKTPTLVIPDVVCDVDSIRADSYSNSSFLSPTSPLSEFDQFLESIDDNASLEEEGTISDLSTSPPFGSSIPYCESPRTSNSILSSNLTETTNVVNSSTARISEKAPFDIASTMSSNLTSTISTNMAGVISSTAAAPVYETQTTPTTFVDIVPDNMSTYVINDIPSQQTKLLKKKNGKRGRKASNKPIRKQQRNVHILEKVFTGTLLGEDMKTSELFEETGANNREAMTTRGIGYSYHNLVYSPDNKWGSSDVKVRILSNPQKPPDLPKCKTPAMPKPLFPDYENTLSDISNDVLDMEPSWNTDALFDDTCDVVW